MTVATLGSAVTVGLNFTPPRIVHDESVKTTRKNATKSEPGLLDHATNNLLRALKTDMVKKDGQVDRAKLRKDSYSERLVVAPLFGQV